MERKSAAAPSPSPRDLRTPHGPLERPLKQEVLKFDLAEEARALHREHGWHEHGHTAKTLVKHHEQSIVLAAMKQGVRMQKHQTAGAVSIHVLSGRVQVHVEDRTIEVAGGCLLALDRALAHDVEALEDSDFVLSVTHKV